MLNIKCPYCGNKTVIPIVYGYPGAELFEKQKKGELKLGGCEITPNNPTKYCLSCHKDFDQIWPCAFFVSKVHFFIGGYFSTNLIVDIEISVDGYKLIFSKSNYDDNNIEETKKIHFDLKEWDVIWTKILKCYVFDWNDKYAINDVIDYKKWELVIESSSEANEGQVQTKRVIGENQYPVYFNNLLKIFSTIVGEKFG